MPTVPRQGHAWACQPAANGSAGGRIQRACLLVAALTFGANTATAQPNATADEDGAGTPTGATTPPIDAPEADAQAPPKVQPETANGQALTPKPPASYLVPPPPTGARYPGMDDLGAGSPFGAEETELRLPIRISTRLRVLSTDLEALSSEGGSATANGILSMVTGGLLIALGLLLEPDDESLSTFLYVFGTATVVRGGVDIAVTPDATVPALEYSHMPMRDLAEVKERLRYGEHGLRGLADGFRVARIMDGSLSLAAGALVIPLVLAPKNFEFETTSDIFVAVGGGISILSGVVSLLTRSEAERRAAAYRKLRRKLRQPRPKQGTKLDLSFRVTSTATGGGMLVHGRF